MKKNSIQLLILASFCGISSAHALEDSEIKFSGDFRVRYESFQNPSAVYNASDSEAHTNHRLKLNSLLRKGENLSSGLSLIHSGEWGSHTGTSNSPLDSTGTGNPDDGTKSGIKDTQNLVLVNRAWGAWKYSNLVNFKFGRLGLEIGDGSVFSENDWEVFPTSHDGTIINWEVNFGRFQFFTIKTNEYGPGFISHDAERNLFGISLDIKTIPDWIKILNAHFIQVVKDETGTGTSSSPAYLAGAKVNEQRIGVTLSGDKGRFSYHLSSAYVFGQGTTQTGITQTTLNISEYMLDSALGFSWNSSQSFKSNFGYHIDSGSKDLSSDQANAYESLYYDIHKYGGFMDVLRWGNLTSANFSILYSPYEDTEIGLTYYYFAHTTKSDLTAASGMTATPTQFGPEYKALSASPSATELGHELDFSFKKTFEGGLKFQGVVAGFLPGSAIKMATDPKQDRIIFEYFAQSSIDF